MVERDRERERERERESKQTNKNKRNINRAKERDKKEMSHPDKILTPCLRFRPTTTTIWDDLKIGFYGQHLPIGEKEIKIRVNLLFVWTSGNLFEGGLRKSKKRTASESVRKIRSCDIPSHWVALIYKQIKAKWWNYTVGHFHIDLCWRDFLEPRQAGR